LLGDFGSRVLWRLAEGQYALDRQRPSIRWSAAVPVPSPLERSLPPPKPGWIGIFTGAANSFVEFVEFCAQAPAERCVAGFLAWGFGSGLSLERLLLAGSVRQNHRIGIPAEKYAAVADSCGRGYRLQSDRTAATEGVRRSLSPRRFTAFSRPGLRGAGDQ
jgi:hypothetical protein